MRTQLALKSVTKRYDDRVVLDQVSITVAPGEKVGVIGDNGSGKSTLLRLLAGRERADNGDVTVLAPGGLGYLAQTVELPARATVQDAIDLALSDLHDLASRVRHAEAAMAGVSGSELDSALAAYAELVADFEARGGYDAELRVEIAAHHLGVPGLERDRPWETLSGGERSRLALAAVVAADPELLLLDEPTNDLDDDAMTWLETRLREHRGAVVVVTHDRVFLERLSSTILEVEAGRVSRHGDGYHGYLAAKAAERSRRLQQFAAWSADLARNQRLVAANVARLDAIPHKTPFAVFGHGAFRSRSRGHGAMGRIRNAKERVERLTARPVAPPPERLPSPPASRRRQRSRWLLPPSCTTYGSRADRPVVMGDRAGRAVPGDRSQRRRQDDPAARAGGCAATGRRARARTRSGRPPAAGGHRLAAGAHRAAGVRPRAREMPPTSTRRRCWPSACLLPPTSGSGSTTSRTGSGAGSSWPGW